MREPLLVRRRPIEFPTPPRRRSSWLSPAARHAPAADAEVAHPTHGAIVRLVFLVYVLFLIEGALRKWVLPEYHQFIYFIRDPFVIVLYVMALRLPLSRDNPFFKIWIAFSILIVLIGGLGHVIYNNGVLVWILGVRNYFLYMPLAFIVGSVFTGEDVARFIRLNLLVALPIAALVLIQYGSLPAAFVNRGIQEDDPVTLVVEGVVRPYGTFTYTGQQVLFAGSLLATLAVAWVLRRDLGIGHRLLLPGTAAVLVITLLTGSRGIYFIAAQIALMVLLAGLISGQRMHRARAWGFIVLLLVGAAALFATVLSAALDHLLTRYEVTRAIEGDAGLLWRAIGTYIGFLSILGDVPLLGYGIGAGTGGARALVDLGMLLPEGELERVVAELGPALGLAFIALRFALVIFLLIRSWHAATRGNPAGLIFLGFAWSVLTSGQLTFSTNNAFSAWLYAGLVLAGTRRGQPAPLAAPSRPPSAAPRPFLSKRRGWSPRGAAAADSSSPPRPAAPVRPAAVSRRLTSPVR